MASDYLSINLANWNSRVPFHERGYGIERFPADPTLLSDVVRFDLPRLGDIAGPTGVHLQCHIGTDTLSLARLGARMAGLDFSAPALDVARRLARDCALEIDAIDAPVLWRCSPGHTPGIRGECGASNIALPGSRRNRDPDTDVTVDLTGLEYMNSATVKPLIELIRLLDQTSRGVLLIFRENDTLAAQGMSPGAIVKGIVGPMAGQRLRDDVTVMALRYAPAEQPRA